MAVFQIPSLPTLIKTIKAKYKALRPDAATSPGSDLDIYSTTLGHLVHGLHLHLLYGVVHGLIPTKASGWILNAWAWFFGLSNGSGGFGRILARGATADEGFTFVADAAGWVDIQDAVFLDSAGQRFKINESYTPSAPGVTPALDVIAISTGRSTNIEVDDGETYTWESQPAGMTATITQVVDLDDGASEEEDSELRARLAAHLQNPPMGGNWPDWEEVAEEASPGNLTAYVWEGQHDTAGIYGATDVALLQRNEWGADRAVVSTDDLWDLADTAIRAQMPIGGLLSYRLLDTTAVPTLINCTLETNTTANEADLCDWDAESVKTTVAAYHKINKTITCADDIHSLITVGDRVIIAFAQAVVTKVGTADGLAADTMIEVGTWFETLDAAQNPYPWALAWNPTGYYVLSGGGKIMACMTAIRELLVGLGPYKGTQAAPIPRWDDELRRQALQSVLIVAGAGVIIDVTVTAPAADVLPTAGSGDDTYFITASDCAIFEIK